MAGWQKIDDGRQKTEELRSTKLEMVRRASVRNGVVKITEITIKIPLWIERPIVFFVLLYRRIRYGYSFRRIPLTQGKYAIVDPDDYHQLSKSNWFAARAFNTFYARRNASFRENAKTQMILMHRQIMNAPPELVVDHINHNGLDNRKANLRLATHTQNNRHAKKTKNKFRSDYKGVSWYSREKRWVVKITSDGICRTIGYFKDEIQAARAYDKAAHKYHGDFAALNFPVSPSC